MSTQQTLQKTAGTPQRRRGPKPTLGPDVVQTSVQLPLDLLVWAKDQPEGMAALVRCLLEAERRRRHAA